MRQKFGYVGTFDRWGRAGVASLTAHASPAKTYRWYRERGFAVWGPQDVRGLPSSLVEERVSRLRARWRGWLIGEMVTAFAMGPFGLVLSGPSLPIILLAWGIEMGFAYGVNVEDAVPQEALRGVVGEGLMKIFGLCPGQSRARGLGRVLLLGLGQDLVWADDVMAGVRQLWARWPEWEGRAIE